MSALPMHVMNEEETWIRNVSCLPRGRLLIDHLAAFNATIASGGVKGIESPIEQTATMRRIFCHDYFGGNAPLGITCKPDGKLPKCIGIMNLSGKHCIYYSESYTLAKAVCFSSQEVQQHIICSLNMVLAKADELGASVIFCFCLPFQAGLARSHWDIRTIRKTSKGVVKDGELCFSSGDGAPRTVPSTKALEHWPELMMRELVRKLKNDATPICLDRAEGEERDIPMTPANMSKMIEMLMSDRKKVMDAHAHEINDMKQKHAVELTNAKGRAEEAEQEASLRIAKVAFASKTADETMQKKIDHLETHINTLREQLLTQQKAVLEANASLAGQKLEREQEIKQSAARQKTLEAQVNRLRGDLAKQTSEQAGARKNQERLHEGRVAELNTKIAELNSNVRMLNSASLAIQASSKQAHSDLAQLQTSASNAARDLSTQKKHGRVLRGFLALAGLRLRNVLAQVQLDKNMLSSQNIAIKDAKEQLQAAGRESDLTTAEIASLRASLKEAEDTAPSPPPPQSPDDKELAEAKREIARKDHLLKETEKRTRSLERRLAESDAEIKKLSSTTAPPFAKDETPKRGSKRGAGLQTAQGDADNNHAHGTVNFSQNTGMFMPPPPHQQAFPTGKYTMDPAIENSLSHLHSALNYITAMARSSGANAKQAEMANAKLDALTSLGVLPQPSYYEPSAHPAPVHGHANGNGYGYARQSR